MPTSRMAAFALLLLTGSNLSAAPCDTAQRGTYLSNVCWLIDRMTDGRETITSFNEAKCTVSTDGSESSIFGVSAVNTKDIFFSRSNGKYLARPESQYVWIGNQRIESGTTGRICWTLYGKGIVRVSTQHDARGANAILDQAWGREPTGEGLGEVVTSMEDEVKVCGPQSMTLRDGIVGALSNLYSKHCDYQESEF